MPPPPVPPSAPSPAPTFTTDVAPLGPLPQFQRPGAPGAAQDFAAVTQGLAGFQRPDAPADAPDFTGVMGGIPDFQRPDAPGDAPDFGAITGRLGDFQRPDAPAAAPGFETGVGEFVSPEDTFWGEDIYGDMADYSREWLDTPNRYMSELALATRAAGDARLAEAERAGRIGIDEWASGRGLVGSSYEGEQVVDLEASIDRNRRDQEAELLRFLTEAETMDRERAGRMALDTGEFGRGLGRERRDEAAIAQQLALDRGSLEVTAQDRADAAEMRRAELGLDVERTAADVEARRTGLELTAAQAGDESELLRAGLALDVEREAGGQALRKGALDVEAKRAQDAAEQFRAQLGLETARVGAEAEARVAGLTLTAAEMQESAEQFRSKFELQIEEVGFDAAFRNAELQQRDGIQRAQLSLQAAIAGDNAAMNRVRHELDVMRAMDTALMNRAAIENQNNQIAIRAYEIMTRAETEGRRMSIEEARWVADLEFRNDDLAERERAAKAEEEGRQRRHDDWLDFERGKLGGEPEKEGSPVVGLARQSDGKVWNGSAWVTREEYDKSR